MELAQDNKDIFAAIGLHPMYLSHHRPHHFDELVGLVEAGGLVALGEVGLDYYRTDLDRDEQQQLFDQQLLLAKKAGLPLLLHVRKAHDQVLSLLRKRRFPHGGIVHAFSGSLQQAQHYIKLGFKISFCGTLTFERARKIRALARELPLSEMVLETDSPDMPPASQHGQRNVPANIVEVAQTLADIRQQPLEQVAQITSDNACQLLGLSRRAAA